MSIDYSKLRTLTAKRIMGALEKDGFTLVRIEGSHHRYRHSDGRRVTVSFHHPGDTFKPKTLKSILEVQALWSENDLKRLKLLK